MAAATALNRPAPDTFVHAVNQLRAATARSHITVAEVRAPRHIAPYSFALSAEMGSTVESRLILLHDPRGHESWSGTLRLVMYLRVDTVSDTMPAPVVWSWLLEALDGCDARFTAVGGTVTGTTSSRFGDLRDPDDAGADRDVSLELRASWTPCADDLAAHARAWQRLLASSAAG